ncbi:MAG: glycosyltransferase [Parachlamydiaceae bacterium]|nr:glycosyltransferase [Parachlamydiaceae bacterium]
MRILIISTYFPPLNSIASLRPYSWAKSWGRAGHDVTVLTTEKHVEAAHSYNLPMDGFRTIAVPFPKWITRLKLHYHADEHVPLKNSSKLKWKHFFKKAFSSFFHFLRNKKGLFNTCRMPDFSDFWIRPALKVIEKEFCWDLVISTAGPYATHIVAAYIKKRKQAHYWVADYRDAWSDSRIYPGLFPFNRLESWVERYLVGQADCITTVSEPFAKTYAAKFPQIKVVTIENGFDPEDLVNLSANSIFPQDGKFRIVYSGSIYFGKQDPSPLFKSISDIQNDKNSVHLLEHLEVLFIGPNQQHLGELISKYNLEPWVKLGGFIDRENSLKMQRDAHALLFLAWNDSSTDGIITGKLFEYLYSKTPILSISNHGIEASQKLIVEANAGVVYTSPIEIAEWLRTCLISPIKQHSEIDPQFLNRYDRRFLAKKLLESCSPNGAPVI